MNPFNLPGPQFLAFYFVLFFVTYLVVKSVIRTREDKGRPSLANLDPYEIAYLRGKAPEALRVAIVSLLDRDLLESAGTTLKARADSSDGHVKRPIEKAILKRFEHVSEAAGIYTDPELLAICQDYEQILKKKGLIAGSAELKQRLKIVGYASGFVTFVALTKIAVALSRGKTNIGFLLALWALAVFLLGREMVKHRTRSGDLFLDNLRLMFARLKSRASTLQEGSGTNDVTLAAAVFGLAILPSAAFGYVQKLFPKATSSTSSNCGSSCSSSCGSSCGGGCGGCGGL